MQRRRVITVAGAALVALGAVAWWSVGDGADETGDGVTAIDDTEGQSVTARCVVADPEGELILQPGSFTPDQPTQLLSVVLEDPENMEVIEDTVAAYRGPEDLQAVLLEFPPRSVSFLEGLADWESRRPLAGLTIRPHDGRQVVLIAVRLEDTSRPGHVRGVSIEAQTPAGRRMIGWEQFVLAMPRGGTCTDEAVAETTEWTG